MWPVSVNMSRIGKKSVDLPDGVEVKIDADKVKVTGPKGVLTVKLPQGIKAEARDGRIFVSPATKRKSLAAFWGLARMLVANAVKGVSQGYEEFLEFQGVGYRAAVKDNCLELNLGFSHPVIYKVPEGIVSKVEKNVIIVSGTDKQLVGETAAQIRKLRPPEPYKGAGIRYRDERIKRKAGKKTAGAGM